MKTILEIEEDHFQTEETQRAVAQFFSGQKLTTESESYGAECPVQALDSCDRQGGCFRVCP